MLETTSYGREDLMGQWPAAASEERASRTIHPIRPGDALWRLEGTQHPTLVGILVSTEHLTVGRIDLLPGQHSDVECHGGDEALYVLSGSVLVRTLGETGVGSFELGEQDGAYLPMGTPHQYYNLGNTTASILFGVAPSYCHGAP
jgi:mannose-6-phosphate isomerase-like protein (cupin superfamily)